MSAEFVRKRHGRWQERLGLNVPGANEHTHPGRPYAGTEDEVVASVWLSKYIGMGQMRGWDQDCMKLNIMAYLRGHALGVCRSLLSVPLDAEGLPYEDGDMPKEGEKVRTMSFDVLCHIMCLKLAPQVASTSGISRSHDADSDIGVNGWYKHDGYVTLALNGSGCVFIGASGLTKKAEQSLEPGKIKIGSPKNEESLPNTPHGRMYI